MYTPEVPYLNHLREILCGELTENRTGVKTYRILGLQNRYAFNYGFPLFTTKKMYWKGIVHELLWFLKGDTNIKYLVDNKVNIWNDDAYRHYCKIDGRLSKEEFIQKAGEYNTEGGYRYGDLGPIYGAQWRSYTTDDRLFQVDQITELIHGLKTDPTSRRHIITAWNPGEINQMALPPCHVLAQFTVTYGNTLWCQMYQRSCDMFLGVPFNVASYSLLTYMLAHVTGLKPGGFIWTGHDCHIYENHKDAAIEQMKREVFQFPQLKINPSVKNLDDFRFEDFELVDYQSHETIKADLVT
jgi:thymidylate synthase